MVCVSRQEEEIVWTKPIEDQLDQVSSDRQHNMSRKEVQGTPDPRGIRTASIAYLDGNDRECMPKFQHVRTGEALSYKTL
jgi:hypothetical protein